MVFITEASLKKTFVFTTFLAVNFFGKSIISELWIIDVLTGIIKANIFIIKGENLWDQYWAQRKRLSNIYKDKI